MGHHGDFAGAARAVAAETETAAITALAVAMLVIAPEGRIEDGRLATALAALAGAPILAGLASRGLARTARDLQTELADRGPLRMLRALGPHMSPERAETALCIAARAALAEGRIGACEHAMLVRAGAAFGVPEGTVGAILQVMAMAHRAAA